jgi:hypothetical protein
MACRWMWDKEIGRWFLPECYGGLHAWDLSGCYCERPRNRLEALESRIEELERAVALTNGNRGSAA